MARDPCRSLTATAHAHRTGRHDGLLLDCPTRRRDAASAAAGAGQPLRFGEYRCRGCHRGCCHRRQRRYDGAGLSHRRLGGAGGVGRHRSRDHTLTRSAATPLTVDTRCYAPPSWTPLRTPLTAPTANRARLAETIAAISAAQPDENMHGTTTTSVTAASAPRLDR